MRAFLRLPTLDVSLRLVHSPDMNNFETKLECIFFRTRWLLAPFFIGLSLAIAALLVKFAKQLFTLATIIFVADEHDIILNILSLIDSALIGSLLLIIAFSGYENFVSKMGIGEHTDRPVWMGQVGFSDLKLKLMGAIVAISAVELLKAFVDADKLTDRHLAWKVGIHLTFVASGFLFAWTDRISSNKNGEH